MDYQKSGYLSRADFTSFVHSIANRIPLEKLRELTEFLDSGDSGKISILSFSKLVLDCFNSNIGGGVYSFF
jgi:Ca2+-binding EF-hand superfamily protein